MKIIMDSIVVTLEFRASTKTVTVRTYLLVGVDKMGIGKKRATPESFPKVWDWG